MVCPTPTGMVNGITSQPKQCGNFGSPCPVGRVPEEVDKASRLVRGGRSAELADEVFVKVTV